MALSTIPIISPQKTVWNLFFNIRRKANEVLSVMIYGSSKEYPVLNNWRICEWLKRTTVIKDYEDKSIATPTTEFNANDIDTIIWIANSISKDYWEKLDIFQCMRISTAYTIAYSAHFHQKRANNADYFQRHIIDLVMNAPRMYIPFEYMCAETLTTYIEALLLHDVKEDWVQTRTLTLTIDWKPKDFDIPISNIDEEAISHIYPEDKITYRINDLLTKKMPHEYYDSGNYNNKEIETILYSVDDVNDFSDKKSKFYNKNKKVIKNFQNQCYYWDIWNRNQELEFKHVYAIRTKVADKIHNIKTIIWSDCSTEKWREWLDEAKTYLIDKLDYMKENDTYNQYWYFYRVHEDLIQEYNNVDEYVTRMEEKERLAKSLANT